MKKRFLFTLFGLMISTACLILAPQAESTPPPNLPSSTTRTNPPAEFTSTPLPPPRMGRTLTPKTPTSTLDPTPQWTLTPPSPETRSIYKPDLANKYRPILEKLPYATEYTINLTISSDLTSITGSQTVKYTNTEENNLREIYFRLFPNILGGEMYVDNVTINDKPVEVFYSLEDSLLRVQLQKPLKPEESLIIRMDFSVTVSQTLGSHYSVQTNYNNVLSLAHAYPMIPVYDDEEWNIEIPEQHGDMTYADMAFFVVTVDAPARVQIAATGREISREESLDRQRVIYAAGPVRDFALAISPSYTVFTQKAHGVTLRFYARELQQAGAQYALAAAARALEVFNRRYGPYPYRELDFAETSTTAGGVEYPGMIIIARQYIVPDNLYIESIVAHEVGHQWFYNLVGNDQLDEPWLDESLTQFITLQYFQDVYGESGAEIFRQDLQNRWQIVNKAEIPIGLAVREYSTNEYNAIIYGRGALFFEALKNEMGADNFDAFMRNYAQTSAWLIATPNSLKTKAENACRCDLTSLFENWVTP